MLTLVFGYLLNFQAIIYMEPVADGCEIYFDSRSLVNPILIKDHSCAAIYKEARHEEGWDK